MSYLEPVAGDPFSNSVAQPDDSSDAAAAQPHPSPTIRALASHPAIFGQDPQKPMSGAAGAASTYFSALAPITKWMMGGTDALGAVDQGNPMAGTPAASVDTSHFGLPRLGYLAGAVPEMGQSMVAAGVSSPYRVASGQVDPQNLPNEAWNAASLGFLGGGAIPGRALAAGADEGVTLGANRLLRRGRGQNAYTTETDAADAVPAPIGHNQPPEPIPGVEDRISTRIPWAKNQATDPHLSNDLAVGLDSSLASGKAFDKNAELLKDYPGLKLDGTETSQEVAQKFIEHSKNNLLALYDAVPDEIKPQSRLWYDGGNKIAHDWAAEFGHMPRAVAGVIAALSPQMDWFQNVSLGRRILETARDQGDTVTTPEMSQYAQGWIDTKRNGGPGIKADPEAADRFQTYLDKFQGKRLDDFTEPYDRAVWTRWYDEAHNSRAFPLVSPQGEFGDPVMTGKGEMQDVGWGGFGPIEKAISILQDPSLANISLQMGGNHKVRNFYNNIISPKAPYGDVTIDTHAIAASQLRPLSGSDIEVKQGLGMSGSADASTGSKGLYGLHAEATRQAAAERGVLPREMQSTTWEAVRGLFSPVQKRSSAFQSQIDDIWKGYQNGEYDQAEAQRRIIGTAGGIDEPSWFRRNSEGDAAGQSAPGPQDLPANGGPSGAAAPGGGTGPPGGLPDPRKGIKLRSGADEFDPAAAGLAAAASPRRAMPGERAAVPALVVARKTPSGIRYGQPGQVHSDLMTTQELAASSDSPAVANSMGYATRDGQFLTRADALAFARKNEPDRAAWSAQQPQFGLDAATYNEAMQPRVQPGGARLEPVAGDPFAQ